MGRRAVKTDAGAAEGTFCRTTGEAATMGRAMRVVCRPRWATRASLETVKRAMVGALRGVDAVLRGGIRSNGRKSGWVVETELSCTTGFNGSFVMKGRKLRGEVVSCKSSSGSFRRIELQGLARSSLWAGMVEILANQAAYIGSARAAAPPRSLLLAVHVIPRDLSPGTDFKCNKPVSLEPRRWAKSSNASQP